jgi:hypothetical protein
MTDLLLQGVLSNICISLVLAIGALIVGSSLKRPQLAYLLWLLVFIKLMTAPLISIPVGIVPGLSDAIPVANHDGNHFDLDSEHRGVALQISEDGNTFSSLQKNVG